MAEVGNEQEMMQPVAGRSDAAPDLNAAGGQEFASTAYAASYPAMSELQIDELEAADAHGSFRQLRRKVMYVSLASSLCVILTGVLNYLFQIETQLEIMRIVDSVSGNTPDHPPSPDGPPSPDPAKKGLVFFVFAGLPAVIAGLSIGLLVPACGYFGAKWVNECYLCMFWSCSCLGTVGGFVGMAITVWIMTWAIPGVDHWVAHCDPAAVCCQGLDTCDPHTGLPTPDFEEKYRDCILGAHLSYDRKFGHEVRHLDPFRCDVTTKILLNCEHVEHDDDMERRFDRFQRMHPENKWLRDSYPTKEIEWTHAGGHPTEPLPIPPRVVHARSLVEEGTEELAKFRELNDADKLKNMMEHFKLPLFNGHAGDPINNAATTSSEPISASASADAVQEPSAGGTKNFFQDLMHRYQHKPVFGPGGTFNNPKEMQEKLAELKKHPGKHLSHGVQEADKKHVGPGLLDLLKQQPLVQHGAQKGKGMFDHGKHFVERGEAKLKNNKYVGEAGEELKKQGVKFGNVRTPPHFGVLPEENVHVNWKHPEKAIGDAVHHPPTKADFEKLGGWRKALPPAHWPGKEGLDSDAVRHSLQKLTSGDEEQSKQEVDRLWKKSRAEYKKLQKRHRGRRDDEDWEPTFDTCSLNPKTLVIMHALHNNLDSLVPKAEFLIGAKTLVSIPLLIFSLLSTIWGFRMYRAAKRGYRPAYNVGGLGYHNYYGGGMQLGTGSSGSGQLSAPLVTTYNGPQVGQPYIVTGPAPNYPQMVPMQQMASPTNNPYQAADDGTSQYAASYNAGVAQAMAQEAAGGR
mmetsp:Transcript_27935/g.70654  ORF Transcript_27935/g.70654 Transcript_27935/m.70654 type:complete len:797 (-) Transcript_27935:931-3321(-)|eukprot:CAMPEP_0178991060 /NCGR_PEP_ID=MMETSP0795-20121207/5311_1 /TAXON_ID=88552 /ORGANISM="Amoebophrya sp., Strain Ameob2" /LENGTH=796 /DNA_ID=CAMNT_0020682713 /DNA_START=227 /DNA_END=2617 /DNA_ORIENTATION=-